MWAIAAALFFFQATDFSSVGMKALEEGKYEAAVQAFTKAIEADAEDYFAHFNLAMAYGLMHKDAEGIAEYRKTLELKPGLYEAELNAGILLMRQKNFAEALPLFQNAAEQKPQEFRPRYYLAEAQLQTGAPAKAEENFRLALALDAKSAAAQLGVAHALARQVKLAEAAPYFRQAAELDANYRDGLLELADLYEKDKQPAEAIAIYREFPENAAAQGRLGELLLETKEYTGAIPASRRGLRQGADPGKPRGAGAGLRFRQTARQGAAAARTGGGGGAGQLRRAHDVRPGPPRQKEVPAGGRPVFRGCQAEARRSQHLERSG
jgi:Tfp pilus assembly protein PilF